ncbi:Conserved_hypothetical protein [Hexamita inflata]|uniref:Transmembrane protein n=1 Tax=Hexamita inflata TaxID=28002 RepID=A0AA86VA84_9EUKA|nr:Conserved hypothetical protein [Hexamita inflata]
MWLIIMCKLAIQNQQDIQTVSEEITKQIDSSIQQFKQLLSQNTLSDYFEPILNYRVQVDVVTTINRGKWNDLMKITSLSHDTLLQYLNSQNQLCYAKQQPDAKQHAEFNNRIVDTNNMDVTFEDTNCQDTGLIQAMIATTYNSLFPKSIDKSRIQNSYQSVLLCDLQTTRQYRYPATGQGFQNISCIQDQFNEMQQIIIGYSSNDDQQVEVDIKVTTQSFNKTIKYNNSIVFDDRCFDRSVRIFFEKQQHNLNQIPQILSSEQINDYISKSKLMQPNIAQIIYSLNIISQELLAVKEKTQFYSNITAKTTFRPTEILIIADCVNTYQQRVILQTLEENEQLFDRLQMLNVNVNFTPLLSNRSEKCQSLDYFRQSHPIFQQNNNLIKNGVKLMPAKMDEMGQMSFSLCTLNDSFIICSQIPQQAFLLQPGAQVLFEKFGQVLIANRNNYMIYVDSFNQNVGKQLQDVCQDLNQSLINTIQTNITTTIRYNDTLLCSAQLNNDLIYIIYLRLPSDYSSVQPNSKTMPVLQFNANKLCFNLSFHDEQCINKLNVYFPENYVGNNQFAPKDSLYLKGVKINSSSSKLFANFLENEYIFGQTVFPTYKSIFNESVSIPAFFIISQAQQQSVENLEHAYNILKQKIDSILYVGRNIAPGVLSIYPDNKLTSNTIKIINNISIDSIINNVQSNSSIAIKDFDCEFYTDTGIIVDTCVYIGIPFTNFLMAQDFFIVRKRDAFKLFMQNNIFTQILDQNGINFYLSSISWDSLYYQQTKNDILIVKQILYDQGYGYCQYSEIDKQIVYNYQIKPKLFDQKVDTDNYRIVPLKNSKSVVLVFKNNYKSQSYLCEQVGVQDIVNNQNDFVIREWSSQFLVRASKIYKISIKVLFTYLVFLVLILCYV